MSSDDSAIHSSDFPPSNERRKKKLGKRNGFLDAANGKNVGNSDKLQGLPHIGCPIRVSLSQNKFFFLGHSLVHSADSFSVIVNTDQDDQPLFDN